MAFKILYNINLWFHIQVFNLSLSIYQMLHNNFCFRVFFEMKWGFEPSLANNVNRYINVLLYTERL